MQASAALLKSQIESALGAPFLTWREQRHGELVPTGVPELDAVTGGLPRGAITDLYGSASSGRTSLLLSTLAEATVRQEVCAVIDSSDAFDPASAAASGADLARILWIRCSGRPDRALKAADMLVQAGGFGLVALDFAGVAASVTRRIPLASWHRFRKAVENTPAVLLVVEEEPTVKSCASLVLEMRRERAAWTGMAGCSQLLRGLRVEAVPRKPVRPQSAAFEAAAFPAKASA
ncbi:MAG TPA: hypothetical protein VN428_23570 [Bryobacteraceae bacterium]|nr:hypothetical protein [Bryobacteraceae bacterium]